MKKLFRSLALLLVMGHAMAQVPTNGLVANYPFINGDLSDLTGNAAPGTNINATLTSDRFGNANSAYSFNGTSSYLDLGVNANNPITTNQVSVSIWVKITGNGKNYPRIFVGGLSNSSYMLFKNDLDDKIYWRAGIPSQNIGEGQCLSTVPLTRNVWHHILAMYNGSASSLYIDGILSMTSNYATTLIIDKTNTQVIGGEPTSFFNGSIDDYRLYNRALSQCEINQLAGIANPIVPTPVFVSTPSVNVCPGTLVNYSINAVANATTYEWSIDGVVVNTSSALTYSKNWTLSDAMTNNGNHVVTVVAKNICETSAKLTSNIKVAAAPVTPVFVSAPTANVCSGTTINYSITAVPNASTYEWSIDGVVVNTSSALTYSKNWTLSDATANNGNHVVSVVAKNSCGISGNLSSNVNVSSVAAVPTFVTTPVSKVSPGSIVNYSINAVPKATLYEWQIDGVVVNSGTTLNYSRTWSVSDATTNNGNHVVTVVAKNACGSSAFLTSNVNVNAISNNGLVAYYPFCGNTNDYGPNGINGVNNGATLTTDRFGNLNSAYQFNGSNQFISLGNPSSFQFAPGTSFSMSAWFLISNNDPSQALISHGTSSFAVYIQNVVNDYVKFASSTVANNGGSNSTNINPVLPINQWNHVVIVNNIGTEVLIYVNNVLANQATRSFTETYSYNNNLEIGRSLAEGMYWNGKIDDLRIYNKALTTDEISSLYTEGNSNGIITANQTSLCKGATGTFNYSLPGTYKWQLNGLDVANSNFYTSNFLSTVLNTAGANTITIRPVITSGCAFGQQVTLTTTANDAPQNTVITGNAIVCPRAGSVSYSIQNPVVGASYFWIVDKGVKTNFDNGISDKVFIDFPDLPGSFYTIKVTSSNNCGSTVTTKRVDIQPNAPAKPVISCLGTGCTKLTVTNPDAATAVSWYVNGALIATPTPRNTINTPSNQSAYVVFSKGTDSNGNSCSNASNGYPFGGPPCAGARQEAEEIQLPSEKAYSIYPNPSNGLVTIETKGQVGKAYVYNTFGQVVAEVDLNASEYIYTVSLSSKGLYTFKIKSGDEIKGYKLVVE